MSYLDFLSAEVLTEIELNLEYPDLVSFLHGRGINFDRIDIYHYLDNSPKVKFKDEQINGERGYFLLINEKWYPHGRIETYQDGKFIRTNDYDVGVETLYHSNGNKSSEITYSEGRIRNGSYKTFSENSCYRVESNYINGKEEGIRHQFSSNKHIKTKYDRSNKIWTEHYIDSILCKKSWYYGNADDEDSKVVKFYNSGNIHSEYIPPTGYYEERYDNENNSVKMKGFYKGQFYIVMCRLKGYKEGKWEFFHENGQEEAVGKFRRNFRQGKWKLTHLDGKVEYKRYKNGVEI